MNNITIGNRKEIDGIEFHEVEGGFGEGKKCILASDIANIHGRELKNINRLINNNKYFFENGVDIIDFKVLESQSVISNHREIYDDNFLRKSKNIYVLSERGYMLLIKFMKDELAMEIYKKLVDGYFNMRRELKEQISESDKLLLNICKANSPEERAFLVSEYTEVVKKPLLQEIDKYSRFLGDKFSVMTKTQLANRLDTKPQTLASILKKVGIYTKTSKVKVDFLNKYPENNLIKETETSYVNPKTGEEKTKMDFQWTGEGAKVVVDYLNELGYINYTDNNGFKLVKK